MSAIAFHPVPLYRQIIWLLCALLLTSCAGPQTAERGAYTSTEATSAQAALALAAESSGAERDRHLLRAAQLYADSDQTAEALKVLNRIRANELATEPAIVYTLLYARVAMADDNYPLARELLNNPAVLDHRDALSTEQRRQWHRLRGEVFALLGDETQSVEEYIALAAQLRNREDIIKVNNAIWQSLTMMSAPVLGEAATQATDPVLAGWYQLALTGRAAQGNIARQVELINQWRKSHPQHPAAVTPPEVLQRAAAANANLPRSLAILLPLSGDLQQAGETLRDGMLAAYFQTMSDGGHLPRLHFYDTEGRDILSLYQQAVSDGADLVIGPLRKEQLQVLMTSPQLSVPVLGLNTVAETPNSHSNLYQFSLSVNDEVEQITERAWRDGQHSVLLMTPNNPWGTSTAETFNTRWQDRGGKLIAIRYNLPSMDYTGLLTTPLLVAQSQERAKRLEKVLGREVDFTPRRRRDIEAIVIATYPQQGRQIKPTLDFLYASDLPIYATSQIYDGMPNPGQNSDLDGIEFTATPWTLPGTAANRQVAGDSGLQPDYRNLFAMGVDSYRLHQWLGLMHSFPDAQLNGLTGQLTMTPDNRIVRTLPWARFANGKVIASKR